MRRVRIIDKQRKISIPKEHLLALKLKIGDHVCLTQNKDQIIIKKERQQCIFCGSCENLKNFNDTLICTYCIEEITKIE